MDKVVDIRMLRMIHVKEQVVSLMRIHRYSAGKHLHNSKVLQQTILLNQVNIVDLFYFYQKHSSLNYQVVLRQIELVVAK